MKFNKYLPSDPLQPYIKHLVVSENPDESTYKVFPFTGFVIGFQYQGRLSSIQNQTELPLATAGISGLSDTFRIFKNAADIGTILVYFTEVGFAHFSALPAHELFGQSIELTHLFAPQQIAETEEKLAAAQTDQQRIKIVEQFLLKQLKNIQTDQLIIQAVKKIYTANGQLRIKQLAEELCISQSPFEKRFRKLVGTTPKKFASIVRFNAVLNQVGQAKSLTELCYENNFFDQAHFIKDFKRFTGDTPENFKRLL